LSLGSIRTFMKTVYLVPVLAVALLTACAETARTASTAQQLAGDSFQLTVERVVTNQSVVVSVLKIHVSHNAFVSVGTEPLSRNRFGVAVAGSPGDCQVALGVSRIITHQGDDTAYIQTFVSAESSGNSGAAPRINRVPAATTLDSFFSVSATSGDYKLDAPVEIGQLNGKPMTLIVGKSSK
jgi:hypothetical protein